MNGTERSSAAVRWETSSLNRSVPIAAGITAILLTYFTSAEQVNAKNAALLACTILVFTAVSAAATLRRERSADDLIEMPYVEIHSPDIDDRLAALDEANEFFASSLNAADMFRLVSDRVNEMVPFSAVALVVPDEFGANLVYIHAEGENSDLLRGFALPIDDGLAGKAFESGVIELDSSIGPESACLGEERVEGFVSSAAIPLVHEGKVFAVFQLFTEKELAAQAGTMGLLGSISSHVTPIFRSSLAFERSISNALTDPLTGLPNERAFNMVLGNQLAESQRRRDERPLTVLTIDIRDFGAVNSMLGHAIGDRMLEFTAARIQEHLRKMDFLARAANDEFQIILPTASEITAFDVIERIKGGFARDEFDISDGEGVTIALNIGWATFWKDGETPDQLVRAAQQRKRQAKSEAPAGVLWFPREYVN